MNLRVSFVVRLFAIIFICAASIQPVSVVAESLSITGPDGQRHIHSTQYGPTSSSDTFWSIARKVRPDSSVSVYQMMSAIFDANPHAFSSNNYNSLETGVVLNIPPKHIVASIPLSLAKARAEKDDKSWTVQSKKAADKFTQETLAAKSRAEAATKQAKAELNKLTQSMEAIQSKNLNLTDELGRALDQLIVTRNDNGNLQDRLEALSEQISTLENALMTAREKNQSLKGKVQALELQTVNAVMPEEDTSALSDPLVMGSIATGTTLTLLLGLWLLLRRKSVVSPEMSNQATVAKTVSKTTEPKEEKSTTSTKPTDEQALAVQLDDDEDIAVQLSNIDEEPEEAALETVLDTPEVDLAETNVAEEDLDDLLDSLEGKETSNEASSSNSIDLNETMSDQDDIDALLAGAAPDETTLNDAELNETVSDQDDIDALLAGAAPDETALSDAELNETVSDQDDIDALLAGAAPDETTLSEAELNETVSDQDDIDALLAGTASDETTLSDAELNETVSDQDNIDALLAGAAPDETTLNEVELNETVSDQDGIDALLVDETPDETTFDETDLDDLDDIEDVVEDLDDEEQVLETNEADFVMEGLEAELETAAAQAEVEQEDRDALSAELDDALADMGIPVEVEHDVDELLSQLEAEPSDEIEEDVIETSIEEAPAELETDLALATDAPDIVDSEPEPTPIAASETEDYALSNYLVDDNELISSDTNAPQDETAATESLEKASNISDEELVHFQKENGFIDIDKLLSEADDASEIDNYREPSDLIETDEDAVANKVMVDVDDAENVINAQLDLARAYIEIDDNDNAKALLKNVILDGNDRQQEEAQSLLTKLLG